MNENLGNKDVFGLVGYPLSHSFSIDYFNQKFLSEDIDAVYLNFEIEDIGDLMEVIAQYPNLKGFNVTAPYKVQIIPYLTDLHKSASEVGAVNVVKVEHTAKGEDVRLVGYNTDTLGFRRSVRPLVRKGMSAMVLGTGGAARAVVKALEQLDVECVLVSRHKSASVITYEEITKTMVHKNKLIVNATPLGKYPLVNEVPPFPFRFLTAEHICYDLIYNPEETLFMKRAIEHGADVKNGLEMLLLQAFASYSIWTTGEMK